jgi:predicted ester cyclase
MKDKQKIRKAREWAEPFAPLTRAEINSIETLYRAFTDKNPDLLDQALAADWQDVPLAPGQGPGPDGLKVLIPQFLKTFPDLTIVVDEIVGFSGRAGVRARIVGTHEGEIFGIAPSGKSVEIALHEFHHLKGGRITHTWHLEDWFGMLRQIGAWPPRTQQGGGR